MAIDLEPVAGEETGRSPLHEAQGIDVWGAVKRILEPLASLRLTVVLFALSIFLILAGTFAQVDLDIWPVIGQYFRCWFAWIKFEIFFPPSFVPEMPAAGEEISAFGRQCILIMQGLKSLAVRCGGMWFPGGKLIGLLLAANLVAAHTVRFKAQAIGSRLLAGLGTIAVGCGVTGFIIAAAGDTQSFQTEPWIPYATLWIGYQGCLGLLCLGSLFLTVKLVLNSSGQPRKQHEPFVIGLLATVSLGLAILLGWLLYAGVAARPADASLRILWQLTQGGVAAVALLAGCGVVFGKRAGIVLLHSGIGLMMFYELQVAMTAIETQMNLEEGETTSFASDIRTYELGVIDKSNPAEDRVTAIPRSMVVAGMTLDLPDLPFRIEIKDILPSSHLRGAKGDDKNTATTGLGLEWFAEPKKPGSGTDMESKADMAAAYVTVTERSSNKPIGTYLVAMMLSLVNETDTFSAGDKTYELALRPKRYYKPYHFRLKDVRKEDYLGTTTPRNYASTVHIEDPERHVSEDKTIWMNNPLRFANETFYQSNYVPETASAGEQTTLSVVANTGWMMPYVACMLVAVGMLSHFLMLLIRFLMRADVAERTTSLEKESAGKRLADRLGIKPAAKPTLAYSDAAEQVSNKAHAAADTSMRALDRQRLVPGGWPSVAAAAAMIVVTASYILTMALPPAPQDLDYDLYQFGQIPVVEDGRVKPLDSAACAALLEISGRTYLEVGHGKDKRKLPAIQWLLDVIADTEIARQYEVFRVENLELQEVVGVKKREGMRYSLEEISKNRKELGKQVELARDVARKDRRLLSVYQRKVLELSDKLSTYENLEFVFGLHRKFERASTSAAKIRELEMGMQFEAFLAKKGHPVFAIAPQDKDHEWQTLAGAWVEDLANSMRGKAERNTAVAAWKEMLSTYLDSKQGTKEDQKRPQDFNRAVAAYLKSLDVHPPRELNLFAIRFESFFNHFQPFTHVDRLYILAFVIGAFGWLGWTQGFNRMAFWLQIFILSVHTFALVGRIYISGRPPVTNLYSSAVFIGWGCVALGLILENKSV